MEFDPKNGKCIIKNCNRHRYARGLCQSCYGAARKLVEVEKLATYEDLVADGLMLPVHHRARGVFMDQFRALKTA